MDSVLRGWVIGHLLGQAINRRREAQPRWCAIAYSGLSGMAWSWNHRSARPCRTRRPWPLPGCSPPPVGLWSQNHHRRVSRAPRRVRLPMGRPPPGHPRLHRRTDPLPSHLPTRRPRPPPGLARPGPRRPPRRAVPALTPHQCCPTGLSQHPSLRRPGRRPGPRHRFGDRGGGKGAGGARARYPQSQNGDRMSQACSLPGRPANAA